MKSVQSWTGPNIDLRTYSGREGFGLHDRRHRSCRPSGPAVAGSEVLGNLAAGLLARRHYNHVMRTYANTKLGQWWIGRQDKRRLVFWDSISDLTRLAMVWADTQPEAFSDRTGKKNLLGQYGLLGRDIVKMLKHIQHAPGVDVVFVGGLDADTNESGVTTYGMQAEGRKIAAELPYIVDQIIVYSDFDWDATNRQYFHNLGKGQIRAFCCKSPNPWGLPAGDRSGMLGMIEEPNLRKLMDKINSGAQRTLAALPKS